MAKPDYKIEFTENWNAIQQILSTTELKQRFRRFVGRATAVNGALVSRQIRQEIKRGIAPETAPLTDAIKGDGKKPLVDFGDLWKAVTHQKQSWDRTHAGLLRTSRRGEEVINFARTLHDGDTIEVTPKMRAMFAALAAVSENRMDPDRLRGRARELFERNPDLEWSGLSPKTTHIIIPGRPFVELAMKDQAMRAQIYKNWRDAVHKAITEPIKSDRG